MLLVCHFTQKKKQVVITLIKHPQVASAKVQRGQYFNRTFHSYHQRVHGARKTMAGGAALDVPSQAAHVQHTWISGVEKGPRGIVKAIPSVYVSEGFQEAHRPSLLSYVSE